MRINIGQNLDVVYYQSINKTSYMDFINKANVSHRSGRLYLVLVFEEGVPKLIKYKLNETPEVYDMQDLKNRNKNTSVCIVVFTDNNKLAYGLYDKNR